MRKIVSIILLLGFVFSLFACTSPQQINQTPTSTVKAETPTVTPTPNYDPYVVNRARLFAAALTTNDLDLTSGMIEYPLTIGCQSGSVQIKSGEEFKKIYTTLANSDFLLSFGQPGKGNTLSSRLAGGLSLSEGDFAIVMNGSGMVKEVHNLTVARSAIKSALVATDSHPTTAEECYENASTEAEKLTCAQIDLETSKNTLQALLTELQPIVEASQENLKDFMIDFDQVGKTSIVQSEWGTFAQDQCAWEASIVLDNSASQLMQLQCLIHIYSQRINDLRTILCEGRGMRGECEASLFYKQGNGSQTDPTLPKSSSSIFTRLPSFSSSEKVEFYSFNRAKLFIAAIATKDKDTVLKLIQYPLKIKYSEGSTLINDQQYLLKYYDAVFSQSFANSMLYVFKSKNPIRKLDTAEEIFSSNNFIDVNISGRVESVSNNSARLENLDPTPTLIPTRTLNPNDCHDTSRTTYEDTHCLATDLDQREHRLSNLLTNLQLSMPAISYQELLKTEKEWEQVSTDHCWWYDGFWLAGSVRNIMLFDCMVNQYDQRIDNLRLFLCEDHGLSGECEASLRYKPKE